MSNQTDPLPPLPNHESPVKIDDRKGTNQLGMSWRRWFELVREKVNVLNQSLVGLASVTTVGFLSKKTDGSWGSRTWQNTSDINVTNPDGDAGNPSAVLTATGATAGTYGDASNIPVVTVDAKGRITLITIVAASGGGGGGGGDGWQTKMLNTPEVRNSTTTATDVTALGITLIAGKKYCYMIECAISNANITPDLKFGWAFSGTFNSYFAIREVLVPGGGSWAIGQDTTLLAPANFATGSLGFWTFRMTAYLDVNTGGVLVPQMAQVTSHASDITMIAGSKVRYRDASV